jgi:hypothetical protein
LLLSSIVDSPNSSDRLWATFPGTNKPRSKVHQWTTAFNFSTSSRFKPDIKNGCRCNIHKSGSEPHGLRQFQVHDSKRKKGTLILSTDTLSTEAYICPGKLPTMIRVQKQGRAGVEPATYRAATDCSTTELTPRPYTRGTVETIIKSTPTQMLQHTCCMCAPLAFDHCIN